MLAILDRWAVREPSLRVTVASPGPAPAVAAEVERRGWRHLPLDFEGWAVFDVSGGAGQARLREKAAAAATRRIVALLEELHPALVVTNTLIHPWGALAAAATGIPHVWFVREFGHRDQGVIFPRGRAAALRRIGGLSQVVVANSLAVRAELADKIPASRLAVSYPPVDLEAVRTRSAAPLPDPAAVFPHPGVLRIGVLGRVTESKGQWRVVEALGLLAERGVRAQVCFIGELLDPGVEDRLRRRGAQLGVADQLVFVGERPNPFPWVAAADICVIPSHREAFGRSTLECLALGKPVITTRQGAGAELVTEASGALVDADDIPALAAAVERYAADPTLAVSQADSARERAAELMARDSLDAAVDALVAAVGAEPAELDAAESAWFGRLDEIADGGRAGLWRFRARLARLGYLAGRAIRDPRKAAARLRAGSRR